MWTICEDDFLEAQNTKVSAQVKDSVISLIGISFAEDR